MLLLKQVPSNVLLLCPRSLEWGSTDNAKEGREQGLEITELEQESQVLLHSKDTNKLCVLTIF